MPIFVQISVTEDPEKRDVEPSTPPEPSEVQEKALEVQPEEVPGAQPQLYQESRMDPHYTLAVLYIITLVSSVIAAFAFI
jgi:hypothetical protein